MRTKLMLISAMVIVAAALVFGATAGSAKTTKPKGKKVTCTAQVTNQSSSGSSTGYDLGFIQCPKPFGKGLVYETYKEGVATGHVTSTGAVDGYLALGTIRGTYAVSGTLTPGTDTFTGTTKITGGTGKYKGAKGSGKITCTTSDLGAHLKCTTVITFKKV